MFQRANIRVLQHGCSLGSNSFSENWLRMRKRNQRVYSTNAAYATVNASALLEEVELYKNRAMILEKAFIKIKSQRGEISSTADSYENETALLRSELQLAEAKAFKLEEQLKASEEETKQYKRRAAILEKAIGLLKEQLNTKNTYSMKVGNRNRNDSFIVSDDIASSLWESNQEREVTEQDRYSYSSRNNTTFINYESQGAMMQYILVGDLRDQRRYVLLQLLCRTRTDSSLQTKNVGTTNSSDGGTSGNRADTARCNIQ